jgi:hypothetical protein
VCRLNALLFRKATPSPVHKPGGLWPYQIIQNGSHALLKKHFPFLSSHHPPALTGKIPVSHPTLPVLGYLARSSRARSSVKSTERPPRRRTKPPIFADQRSDHRRSATGFQDAHSDYHWVRSIILLLSFTLWHFQTLAVQDSETPGSQATRSDDTSFCLWPTTVSTVPDENSNNVVANPRIGRVLSTSSIYTFSRAAPKTVHTQLPQQLGRG